MRPRLYPNFFEIISNEDEGKVEVIEQHDGSQCFYSFLGETRIQLEEKIQDRILDIVIGAPKVIFLT